MKIQAYKPSDIPNFSIVGSIDEDVDFNSLAAEPIPLHLDCFEIYRINSVGIRKWIAFFESLRKKNVPVYYYRVSTALIEQFNAIRNFGVGGTVISAVMPFLCENCKRISLMAKTKEEVLQMDLENDHFLCNHCGETALRFDDDAEEYLRFWKIKK